MQITDFGSRQIISRDPLARYGISSASSKSSTKSAARAKAVAASFATRISELKKEFAALRELVTDASLSSARNKAGFVRSNLRVTSLDPDGSPSTISSAEEVNTTPTSVDNRLPTVQRWTSKYGWIDGNSSGNAAIHGTYTGSTDSAYRLKMDGSVNLDSARQRGRLRFTVYKDNVAVSATNVLNKDYSNDTKISFGDGLEVSFDGGKLRGGETFFFNAYATVGTDLDPSKAFNGTGAGYAGLSDSTPVVDGSFKVNGTEIAVNASDTLDELMTRINSSTAKVTAEFDTATDTITFTNTVDGAKDITFDNDSSGIVAALKLDTAVTTKGLDADRTRTVDEVGGLAAVSSGTMTINGVDITIDTSVDTLDDILNRINDSDAGVKATYSDNTGRLSIANKTTSEDLTVDSDSTGLLSTMNVATGTYASTQRRGISATKAKTLTEAMVKVVTELNDLYAKLGGSNNVSAIDTARNNISRSMRGLVGSSGRTQLGLKFDFGSTNSLIEFDETAQRKFRAALSGNASGVSTFLEGKGTKDGFFDIIDEQMKVAESALAAEFGSGILVSTSA